MLQFDFVADILSQYVEQHDIRATFNGEWFASCDNVRLHDAQARTYNEAARLIKF